MEAVYLLKFGGNAIRGKDDMMRLSSEIAQLIHDGAKIVLVHGGGPEISEEMERRGMTPQMVGGFRITDEDSLEVTRIVLKGINEQVVECLGEASVKAMGVPGYMCTLGKKKDPIKTVCDGKETLVDLGFVGEVCDVHVSVIEDMLNAGVTPVIYPTGKDADGHYLNINADTMAAGIAAGLRCKEMIAITDVPGILRDVKDPTSKINKITLKEVDQLISEGVISGGMIPKVEACRKALEAGVKTVRMVNGKDKRSIVTDIMKDVPHGTIIIK
jgi:acetylglutamate kinase